jgi:hypothetical protein
MLSRPSQLELRIVEARPPNYAEIAAALGPPPATAVFAYGDAVYVPAGGELPADLRVHEAVHLRQQAELGGPGPWWRRYLAEPAFRLEQELEAYRAQVASHPDRASRRRCLARVARDLASPMYGRIVTVAAARRLIWTGVT